VVDSPYGGVIFDTGTHLIDTLLFVLGLDDLASGGRFEVRQLSKTPAIEPSHECVAELALSGDTLGDIEARVQLSRREPVAPAIKVYGECGVLVLPKMAEAPVLRTTRGDFIVGERFVTPRPTSELPAFLEAHEQFLSAPQHDATSRPLLDGANFILLTAILEALTKHQVDDNE
jgi:predicted dehydrogenase